jgi:hypothetical protein
MTRPFSAKKLVRSDIKQRFPFLLKTPSNLVIAVFKLNISKATL